MQYSIILAFLMLLPNFMVAQKIPPIEYLFTYEIEKQLAEGKIPSSKAATYYGQIGEYQRQATYSEVVVSWGIDTLDLSTYQTVEAAEKIVKMAKDQRIVIISEAHTRPQHRIFAKQLISRLAEYGFRHLALETLASTDEAPHQLLDTGLNNRKYALNSPYTGTYTTQASMADVLRTAFQKDYEVFGYERARKIEGKSRDEIQADNVINYLQKSGAKKIILFCGWYHAVESDFQRYSNTHWLAYYLKNRTGIDPLTIYQDNFTEKFVKNEHPLLQERTLEKPSVFIDTTGNIPRLSPHVDIEVIHPKTYYKNGRPSWLYEEGVRQAFVVEKDSVQIAYPMFVKAFVKGEKKDGVPMDCIEWRHRYDHRPLVLPKGNYIIRLDNKKEQQEFEVKIQ